MPRFTDRYVRSLKPREKMYDVREGQGFGIRILTSGKKSWFFIYEFKGKKRRMTLGDYPAISLSEARRRHYGARTRLKDEKVDPAVTPVSAETQESQEEPAVTVAELAEEYLEKWAKPRKKSWEQDQRTLNKDILPKWECTDISSIRRKDVIALLDGVTERGAPVQANRVLALLGKMFNFAVDREMIEFSPCSRIKKPNKEQSKTRFLTAQEIKEFWRWLDGTPISIEAARALKMILATAQRPNEVAGMHSNELDGGWWTIPSERVKNKRGEHFIPLSDLALELIGDNPSGPIFPGDGQGGGSIQRNSLSQAIRRHMANLDMVPFTPHDLRRTAATGMSELRLPQAWIDAVLNHTLPGIRGIYNRWHYADEKREALDAWGKRLRQIVAE